ncbi:MAG: MAPEG family protein [Ahrensia sp.]|nr:MAPEG family protein [Ahrensia sp.]
MENLYTAVSAVGIYSALCYLILFWLSLATGKLRGKYKISIGDGGNQHLVRIMRGHANATENMPIFLITLLIAALMGMPLMVVHIFGIVFVIARALHAHYFIQEQASMKFRMVGFGLSTLAQIVLVLGLLAYGVKSIL